MSLQANVGEPPTGALLAVYRPLTEACDMIDQTAPQLKQYNGIDKTGYHRRDSDLATEAKAKILVAEERAGEAEEQLVATAARP